MAIPAGAAKPAIWVRPWQQTLVLVGVGVKVETWAKREGEARRRAMK
jgi:hypothetical protein